MSDLFRIKPLEWEWFETTFSAVPYTVRGYKASHPMFSACVWEVVLSDGRIQPWHYRVSSNAIDTPCASPEEGKQLAEAHWREYIKQALVPVETNK